MHAALVTLLIARNTCHGDVPEHDITSEGLFPELPNPGSEWNAFERDEGNLPFLFHACMQRTDFHANHSVDCWSVSVTRPRHALRQLPAGHALLRESNDSKQLSLTAREVLDLQNIFNQAGHFELTTLPIFFRSRPLPSDRHRLLSRASSRVVSHRTKSTV